MNKKLLAFISLFSLTLVLGVYYVITPISFNPNKEDLTVNVNIEEGENAYFVSLELEKESEYELYITSQEEIVFSSDETNDLKVQALNNISNINKIKENEKKLKESIINLGYNMAFVQIKNDNIKAIVSKKEATPLDAATIIGTIKKEAVNSNIEVIFK